MNANWDNRAAADYIHVVAVRFGQPSAVDPTPGGIAIWKREFLQNTCLERIEVRDEAVPHCDPTNHMDCVYAYVNYAVPGSKYTEVTTLTGNVGYDPLKKQLWARCGSVEACVALLALATQVGEGHISLNFAQANRLVSQYLVAAQDAYQANRLRDLLCYNIKHQRGDPLPSGNWAVADPHPRGSCADGDPTCSTR